MIRFKKSILLLALSTAAIAFSSAAKADFCRVAGNSPHEIGANVLKTKAFKKIGGTALFVGYFNQKSILIVTRPGHPAHPAAACQRASKKTGDWEFYYSFRCQASWKACDVLLRDFKVLYAQWNKAVLKQGN
jgi:hypothetical protein